jgi:uncharacterized repeat protein (TIGR03847 family)
MWDFGRADLLEAEAIGEPGNRTFRLRVLSRGDAASLWLEKEQLTALTLAIRQLLEQTDDDDSDAAREDVLRASFPDTPKVDFKLGKLGIGYDEAQRIVTIFAYEMESEDDASPTFSCQLTRGQCRTFADHAEETISAGRPLCVVCGGPIDSGGHRCQRRNGHSDRAISLAE